MSDQQIIRKQIQQQRKSLSKAQQVEYSTQICKQLVDSKLLDQAQRIAFYLPVSGEADPTALLSEEAYRDKQFYVPILSDMKPNHLAFAEYHLHTPMRLNKFNIPEPDLANEALLHEPARLDIVIAPMVAVDHQGNRIGMGGGFYDRTFAFKQHQVCSPLLIGFAYDFQLISAQVPQRWDVAVDRIATQQQMISPLPSPSPSNG